MTTNFFSGPTEQSRAKARIVSKYFDGWSKILYSRTKKRGEYLQFIDLFAGPGRYQDGSESTPLLVLRKVLANPKMHDMVRCVFNDSDVLNVATLRLAIEDLPNKDVLKYKPTVANMTVDEQVTTLLEKTRLMPTLTFLDPFGYKGLSMRLVRATLKDWGCDCIFFFNFNRVNAAVHNESVEEHITALFDADDAAQLRQLLNGMRPHEREARLIEELTRAVRRQQGRHVLDFAFKNDAGSRTSHYLIFATKHPTGCKLMKEIMAKESSWEDGGVPSYTHSPRPTQRDLFNWVEDPLGELERALLERLAGQELTAGEIYLQHGLETRYTERNFKDVLLRMEEAGCVKVTPAASERRAGTMADHNLVEFPAVGSCHGTKLGHQVDGGHLKPADRLHQNQSGL